MLPKGLFNSEASKPKKNLSLDVDDYPEFNNSERAKRSMSYVLKNTKTPQIVRGMEIDESMRQKIRSSRSKVLDLQIVAEVPDYDDQGKPI